MPLFSSQDFARALSGAAGGALGGGAAGAAIGAWNAPSPEERAQGARGGARKGAVGGAALGATTMAVPSVLANLLGMRAHQMGLEQAAANAAGYQDPKFDEVVASLGALRDRLREALPSSAAGALGAGALGAATSTAGTEAKRRVMGHLRQRMFPERSELDASPKVGAAGGVAPEDNPQDQRARRLAELLKRAVPTTSAGGSTAPTSPRGTP